MSVETLTPVNDYIRWPSSLPVVLETIERWRKIADQHQWFTQFRTTPTILSLPDLLSIYEYALSHNITVESCNFIEDPAFMRPSVLPREQRNKIIEKLKSWISKNQLEAETVINIRNPNMAKQQIVQDLQSYVNYLTNEPDESNRLPDLVSFLKRLEANRGNCILDYLPEYEDLFRSAGY